MFVYISTHRYIYIDDFVTYHIIHVPLYFYLKVSFLRYFIENRMSCFKRGAVIKSFE